MVKDIAMVAFILIALVLAYAATRPDDFRIERSTTMKAAPEKVFAFINDFRQWGAWSPWEKVDADLKRTYSGNAAGIGAAYEWAGDKAGVGRMEIVESSPAAFVKIKLDFLKPMEAHNTAEFSLHVQGDLTHVTWAMYGRSPYLSKLLGIFFSIDQMVGKDFEVGLRNMQKEAEKQGL